MPLTEKDADLIADAISGRSAEGRLDAGRRGMTEALRGTARQKREQRETAILARFNGTSRETEPTPTAAEKALADVVAERKSYEAAKAQTERETADALAALDDAQ
jgi:hypothetical protein